MSQLGSIPAVVLAGGLGTRLRPAFRGGPKCLAPVGDRPFLDYLIAWLQRQGIREAILCVGYKRSQIQRRYGGGRKYGLALSYSAETTPLGTAGALLNASKLIVEEPFVVLNGDSFLDVDLNEMLTFQRRRRSVATIALVRSPSPARYGTVHTGPDGRIMSFREKSGNERASRVGWINGGVYLMQKKLLKDIAKSGPQSLERDVFPRLATKGLFGFRTDGYFIDIGIPSDYRRAQRELPKKAL